jgi:hypothetical protein
MHLVSCARPTEPLEDAPRTSLRTESPTGSWKGFWSTTEDVYYTRCTREDGTEEWFTLVEDATEASTLAQLEAGLGPQPMRRGASPRRNGTAGTGRHVMLLLTRSASARGILVGNARPKTR